MSIPFFHRIPPEPAGQSLTTAEDTALAITLSATDPQQCELTFAIVTPPTKGSLSALTANQIVAGVVSLGVFGLLWGIDPLAALLPHPVDNWVTGVSLLARFTPFAVGAFYTSDFAFFFALAMGPPLVRLLSRARSAPCKVARRKARP